MPPFVVLTIGLQIFSARSSDTLPTNQTQIFISTILLDHSPAISLLQTLAEASGWRRAEAAAGQLLGGRSRIQVLMAEERRIPERPLPARRVFTSARVAEELRGNYCTLGERK